MLILIPPSEGKTAPTGPKFQLENLSWPQLNSVRKEVLAALIAVSSDPQALAAMKLTGAAAHEFPANAALATAPSAPASQVYTGVLFQAIGFSQMSDLGRRRAASHLAIASALWGLVRPTDLIPAYRLTGGTNLPGVGGLNRVWKPALAATLDPVAESELIVDCRSATYTGAWKAREEARGNVVPVRVFQQRGTKRTVVSHHAKHTRGLLVRHLLEFTGALPTSPAELAAVAAQMPGVTAELNEVPARGKAPATPALDLIVPGGA